MRKKSLSQKLEINIMFNIMLDYKLGEELGKGKITAKLEAWR